MGNRIKVVNVRISNNKLNLLCDKGNKEIILTKIGITYHDKFQAVDMRKGMLHFYKLVSF